MKKGTMFMMNIAPFFKAAKFSKWDFKVHSSPLDSIEQTRICLNSSPFTYPACDPFSYIPKGCPIPSNQS